MMNIRDIDLNLLVIFEALLSERNVTRAAQRVGLSQAAMSNALARLRIAINDPLFIRTPQGMVPTSRAIELEHPVREALASLKNALESAKTFDPKTSTHRFTLAMTDYAEWIVLPALLNHIARTAPGVSIEVRALTAEVPEQDLAEGKIDLAIGYFWKPAGHLKQQELFIEDFVCVVRKGHPFKKDRISVGEYADLKHLVVAPWGGLTGTVDTELDKVSLRRQVHVSTPHFLVSPRLVSETDFICTLPRRMAEDIAKRFDLKILEHPVKLPRFNVTQLWHERTHHEGPHQWLRTQILSVLHEDDEKKKAA